MTVVESGAERGMFVGGDALSGEALERTTVRDPASGESVGGVPRASAREVDLAVQAAAGAFPAWSATPAATRGDVLRAAAERVHEELEQLALTLTREQGKPLREARLEITRCVHTLEHYAGLAKAIRGGYVPALDEGAHGLVLRRPLGVVAAIVPWNFPTTLLANKLGPALVAGNTVVAKPAETTPLTTLRIAELMHEAGLPAGAFNVVTGSGSELGRPLVTHPLVGKVAFTGSTPVGRQVMALAAEGTKRLTLELGGSDPLIVCADADLDAAVSAASVGRFFNCGQACLAVKRLYVHEAVADEVVEKLLAKVARLRVGPGTEEGVTLGPLHTAEQRATIEAQVADALERGAELLCGGSRPGGAPYDAGFFYEPTLLLEPASDARVAAEEVFGPVLPIWRVRDLAEAIERANSSPFGLGSSIFTRDLDAATIASEQLRAGYTWVNSPQKVYDELPFGGVGESGFGKEHGIEALDHYTELKSVVVKRSARPG
jgi:succinate-semialdehyde dehydrogenase/glutarate-semialdehyde dehydrogenase